jgi:hypothetical protein
MSLNDFRAVYGPNSVRIVSAHADRDPGNSFTHSYAQVFALCKLDILRSDHSRC